MIPEVAQFHVLLQVVVIKIFFHPSNVAPIKIPVAFSAARVEYFVTFRNVQTFFCTTVSFIRIYSKSGLHELV